MKHYVTLLKRFFAFMNEYRAKFIFAFLLIVVATSMNSLAPYLWGLPLTELQQNVSIAADGTITSTVDFGYIARILLLVLAIITVGFSMIYIANIMVTKVIQETMKNLRNTVSTKLNRLPVSYFDSQKQGDILARITNDVDGLGNALQQGLITIVTASWQMIVALLILGIMDWKTMLVTLIIIPGGYFISSTIVKKSQPHFNELQKNIGRLNGYVSEDYSGFNVIKLFRREDETMDEFMVVNRELTEVGFKANFLSAIIMPLLSVVTYLVYIFVTVTGALAVIAGTMTLGNLQASLQYVWRVNDPVQNLTQLIPVIQGAFASLERIFEILDAEEEATEVETIALPENIEGHVVFDDVSFGYTPEKMQVKNMSFEAKPGQTIAVVGPTGAGKTTLINLLMRFYEINSGTITIDGVSIKDYTRQQVRSLFGMVLQDAWLYQTSISENVRFGKLDAEEYEIVDAVKTANVHHYIKTLEDGYDTVLNEEVSNISQGQKQLLTIARAVVSDPKILILDEATSSVDTRLEVLIQEAMEEVMKGRTSFVIAHRLSTIRNADLILVMKDGVVIEKGTHDELLEQGGFYEELYNSQFSEEQE